MNGLSSACERLGCRNKSAGGRRDCAARLHRGKAQIIDETGLLESVRGRTPQPSPIPRRPLTAMTAHTLQSVHPGIAHILFYRILVKPQNQNISLYTNSDFRYKSLHPVPLRRGAAHRHVTLGAGCDGRALASGGLPPTRRWPRTAKSCGPGAATVASIRPARAGTATVTTNAAHRGEHEGNRKAIARGKPGSSG